MPQPVQERTVAMVFEIRRGWSEASLAAALPKRLRLLPGRKERRRRLHLDTFDWRLWSAGHRLAFEVSRAGRQLCWQTVEPPARVVVAAEAAPRHVDDLSETLRGTVAALVTPRALLVQGEVELERRVRAVVDREGKTVLRLVVERTRALAVDGAPARARHLLRLERLRGYEAQAEAVSARLAAVPGLAPAELDELETAAATRGRRPGDYSSRPAIELAPEAPAGESLRAILAHLLATAEANVAGVLGDVDSEFLHDLRVAVRRARSVLGQLRGVLAGPTLTRLEEELRWAGEATGECRDLDVLLLDLAECRPELSSLEGASLAPLAAHLADQRLRAHANLVATLESRRFAHLLSSWRALTVRRRLPLGPEGRRPTVEVAGERVWRAYRRFLRHARALPDDLPVGAMHRLRIDGKKLRYLLELFAKVLPGLGDRVRTLKAVQDELGMFHDLHLHAVRVAHLARELEAEHPGDAGALLAAGTLIRDLETRRAVHGERFLALVPDVTTPVVRKELAALRRAADRS